MLKLIFDTIMERRSRQLINRIGPWLPPDGPLLDLGSGTGHLAAQLERDLGIEVATADVTDMHVVGRTPVLITNGVLPFEEGIFAATLLIFMLAYPQNPRRLLMEAARVTRGPIILVQSLYSGPLGYAWLRVREYVWTIVGFYISKFIGYIPVEAKFTMNARRFYTPHQLQDELVAAGLRIRARQECPVLPNHSLVVAGWVLERDD